MNPSPFNFKVSHFLENRDFYILAAVTDRVFSENVVHNQLVNYKSILHREMTDELETHLLPMMVRTCRDYITRLPRIQANADFLSFTRAASPVPVPLTEEEQSSPLPEPASTFSAYGLPYPVKTDIEEYRRDVASLPDQIISSRVHAESRALLFLVRHDK